VRVLRVGVDKCYAAGDESVSGLFAQVNAHTNARTNTQVSMDIYTQVNAPENTQWNT